MYNYACTVTKQYHACRTIHKIQLGQLNEELVKCEHPYQCCLLKDVKILNPGSQCKWVIQSVDTTSVHPNIPSTIWTGILYASKKNPDRANGWHM